MFQTFLILLMIISLNLHAESSRPRDILDVKSIVPGLNLDMRYFGNNNFIGRRIPGYQSEKCFLQEEAAMALNEVETELNKKKLSLIIYDCYRPQRSVDYFMNWIQDPTDDHMRKYYYPEVKKENLVEDGYIAEKSGHSKANTIDLGLISLGSDLAQIRALDISDCRLPLNDKEKNLGLIDMGSKYDCFDIKSHTNHKYISKMAKYNRKILLNIMGKKGFKNYNKEWWHYSFKSNKYPNTYFNFPIK